MESFFRRVRLLIQLSIKTQNDTLTIHSGHEVQPEDWQLLPQCAGHLRRLIVQQSNYADGSRIEDIPCLESLKNLEFLSVQAPLASLERVALLPRLTHLTVEYCRSLSDLRPLSSLPQLIGLYLTSNEIRDISPLSGLQNLQQLDISGNLIEDFSPLCDLRNLRTLQARGNPVRVAPPMPLTRIMQPYSGIRPPLASFLHLATPPEADKIWVLMSSSQREDMRELIDALAESVGWEGEDVLLYMQAARHIFQDWG